MSTRPRELAKYYSLIAFSWKTNVKRDCIVEAGPQCHWPPPRAVEAASLAADGRRNDRCDSNPRKRVAKTGTRGGWRPARLTSLFSCASADLKVRLIHPFTSKLSSENAETSWKGSFEVRNARLRRHPSRLGLLRRDVPRYSRIASGSGSLASYSAWNRIDRDHKLVRHGESGESRRKEKKKEHLHQRRSVVAPAYHGKERETKTERESRYIPASIPTLAPHRRRTSRGFGRDDPGTPASRTAPRSVFISRSVARVVIVGRYPSLATAVVVVVVALISRRVAHGTEESVGRYGRPFALDDRRPRDIRR